jgi:hypothetical protein
MKYIHIHIIILSIYKSCDSTYFFHGMIIEIMFNNKIQIFLFSNQFIFLRRNVFWAIILLKGSSMDIHFVLTSILFGPSTTQLMNTHHNHAHESMICFMTHDFASQNTFIPLTPKHKCFFVYFFLG